MLQGGNTVLLGMNSVADLLELGGEEEVGQLCC